jgi:antitoxin ParD1/3/4
MRASMNISLPESMKAWVDEQVAAGGYGTTSEFFRQLIRDAQQRRLREQIDAKLLQNLESGKPIPVDAEYWEKKRQQLAKRVQRSRDRS